jgi:hypothetical protein
MDRAEDLATTQGAITQMSEVLIHLEAAVALIRQWRADHPLGDEISQRNGRDHLQAPLGVDPASVLAEKMSSRCRPYELCGYWWERLRIFRQASARHLRRVRQLLRNLGLFKCMATHIRNSLVRPA